MLDGAFDSTVLYLSINHFACWYGHAVCGFPFRTQSGNQELDHEFQLELANARMAHDEVLQRKVEDLLSERARYFDQIQAEKHMVVFVFDACAHFGL